MQIIFNNTTEEILPLKKDLTLVETTIFNTVLQSHQCSKTRKKRNKQYTY